MPPPPRWWSADARPRSGGHCAAWPLSSGTYFPPPLRGSETLAPDEDVPFFEQEHTLHAWLAAWLDGSLRQPWLVTDPTSGRYRGATITETEAALADTDSDDGA